MKNHSFVCAILLSVLFVQGAEAKDEIVPKRVGEELSKTGDAITQGLHKGGESAAKSIKDAGKWVGKQMQKGGEKLEKVSK